MFTVGRGAGTQRVDRRRRIEEESVTSEERLRELEDKYEDFKVYDNQGNKIGKVDDLFVDETDREEYIGVKLGFLGRKSTLIPMDIVRVNEADRSIEVSESKDRVTDAPSFDDDEDITGDYERRIREHFGLESTESSSSSGYGAYAGGGTGEQEHDDSRDYSSQAGTTDDGDSSESSSEGTEYADERTGSTSGGGSQSVPEYGGSQEGSTGSGESLGSSGSSETGSLGSNSSGGTTQGAPTSRQTEETETFQEGGRTKVRRRIVREEIVEEDPNSTQ